ncbi:MAG: hypothetical protein EOO09_15175 [Chitinophagaceae bacterium]|nr:MAG: hypothetical protein EOO09_15175 [Chitinophagaceae bacterium]
MINHNINVLRIKAVNTLLEELSKEVVYVGGATVSLYADRAGLDFRPTQDVDILVEVSTTGDYLTLQEKLRNKGFEVDTSAKFVGRFKAQGLIIDLMATNEAILGFSNRWYSDGFRNAIDFQIDQRDAVKIFTSSHFIASKLEAYKNRGKGDGRTSTDFEDIIYVLANRMKIWEEMLAATEELRDYLKKEFAELSANPYLEEWVEGHVGFDSSSATAYILDQWKQFSTG